MAAKPTVEQLEKQLAEQNAQIATLTKSLKNPVYPNQRFDAQGRIVGEYEETDETIDLSVSDEAKPGFRAAQSYKDTKRSLRKSLRREGYQPWGTFKSLSDFVRSGMNNHQSSSFRERHLDHFGKADSSLRKAVQGMSEGAGADGGFTVMPEFSNKIIDRVYSNSLWDLTDNYTVSGNNMTFLANAETSRATGSRHGGLQGYWIGEGGTITKSKPTLREITLKLLKLGVVVYLTQEIIDDGGQALEQYVARKASEEFNFMIGDALINGTGVGQPLGLLNAPSLISIAKESGQSAATIQPENIVKMFTRFYAPNLSNARWLKNQDTGGQLQLLTVGIGTSGQLVYHPPGGLSGSPYATLQGLSMMDTEFNPTLGTQGDLVLADMSQVLSISKGSIVQAVSMHVEFLTDQLALRFTMRLNARPWESAPITPYKGSSNTQSSFVALDTRA